MATSLEVERRSIDPIPEDERHGRPRSLFTLWFAANMQITSAVTGALTVLVGLHPLWALVAIALGNALGAVPMALHAAQGPKLGIPQMIQSRAQFGVHGAVLPLLLVVLMYLGYFASGNVLGGQALAEITGLPVDLSVLVYAGMSALIAIVGYRLIHRFGWIASLLSVVVFVYLTFRLLGSHDFAAVLAGAELDFPAFLLALSLTASWQLTFGPYVADTSRYLPSATSIRATFWWTYAGTVIGAVWAMSFGALAYAVSGNAFKGREVAYVVGLGGEALVLPLLLAIALGKFTVNVLNIYGGYMTVATTLTAFNSGTRRLSPATRIAYIALVGVAGGAIAVLGRGDFLSNFVLFLHFLLYFLTPWSAINLVDFYLLRKEKYALEEIYDPDGRYGRWCVPALVAYLLGILVQIPFSHVEKVFTGFAVPWLGGADIAWLLGLAVPGLIYWLAMRGRVRGTAPAEAAARE
ncbi:NCS1 family nucleobase:cation symporter-1 [Saccharopolyspora erythraea NRRL 2338]|uniref:Cytosine/purines/uracil/thiamine/allantoin permease family protein n=2 Tax=Saccharopolyspora erythraea TaxID=1836 RepID=A4FQP5_SACEN|nr:cytosine permease [Saccharopolyspora erythraea]EQD87730.1 sulfonate ABC transporter substrate-binding protein [Saccharopolyspora erythraea D]PFG92972.1 NCS1 family nucleobase:cation symporter-1 [Saccharopolyspora erythraea NRRL 2338]QRK89864.1 cytosine permease [Saccharopolyspora erythraea]CAM06370.1 cytosine/purines/uracil/thiamine/allantoin permease family protein [Saccharopolyspora erythraea NRRL 2338]